MNLDLCCSCLVNTQPYTVAAIMFSTVEKTNKTKNRSLRGGQQGVLPFMNTFLIVIASFSTEGFWTLLPTASSTWKQQLSQLPDLAQTKWQLLRLHIQLQEEGFHQGCICFVECLNIYVMFILATSWITECIYIVEIFNMYVMFILATFWPNEINASASWNFSIYPDQMTSWQKERNCNEEYLKIK